MVHNIGRIWSIAPQKHNRPKPNEKSEDIYLIDIVITNTYRIVLFIVSQARPVERLLTIISARNRDQSGGLVCKIS